MTEDNERDDFDLSAWEAPPPPVDLADGVVARAREGAPALEVAEPRRMVSRARQRLIGGAAVVVLAVAAVLMIWLAPGASHETAGPATSSADDGSSAGSDARKLVLPGAIATLDPGAQITWHRHGDDLVVSQRAGNATWQVDGGHRLVLDTGAVGASVEATGASLRVEVPMNLMDKRVLAGSAISAAVVAFATVTVYEGHVKTTTPTRTVIVEPGAQVALSGGVSTSVAGTGDAPGGGPVAPSHAPPTARTVTCDARALAEEGRKKLGASDDVGALKALAQSLDCKDDPSVYPTAYMAACGAHDETQARHYYSLLPSSRQLPLLQICLRAGVDPRDSTVSESAPPCDATALADTGRAKLGVNDHAGALNAFARSLDCKDDPKLYPSAYMAACGAGNIAMAKHWFKMLPPDRQRALMPICMRGGIDPR